MIVLFLMALSLGGCASNAELSAEVDALKERVNKVETRLKRLEGNGKKAAGKGGKAKAGKGGKAKGGKAKVAKGGKAKAGKGGKAKSPPEKGKVLVSGDAVKVLFSAGKRKVKVPNDVAIGEYKIMAAFEGEENPSERGSVKVAANETVTVECLAATASCVVK